MKIIRLLPTAIFALAFVAGQAGGDSPSIDDLRSTIEHAQDPVDVAIAISNLADKGKAAEQCLPLLENLLGNTAQVRRGPSFCLTEGQRPAKRVPQGQEIAFFALSEKVALGALAAEAMCEIGGPGREMLRKALGNSNPVVRENAAFGLAPYDYRGADAQLSSLLHDPVPTVRVAGARALLAAPEKVRTKLAASIQQALTSVMKEGNDGDREKAAALLRELPPDLALQPLIDALTDADKFVRLQAAKGLGAFRNARAIAPLSAALNAERDEDCLSAFVAALIEADARPEVAALADNKRVSVRQAAVVAIGRACVDWPDWIVEYLIHSLGDDEPAIRSAAAAALNRASGEHFGEEAQLWEQWRQERERKRALWAEGEKRERRLALTIVLVAFGFLALIVGSGIWLLRGVWKKRSPARRNVPEQPTPPPS